jgi:hypothetical protein
LSFPKKRENSGLVPSNVEHNIGRPAPLHRDFVNYLRGQRPAAQAALVFRGNAGEPGRAADYAVDDADRTIGGRTCAAPDCLFGATRMRHWHNLLRAMGRYDLRDDPRFAR